MGINANIASAGVGLVRAARILGDPSLRSVAQSQLDWILGCNPFYASTVVGLGHNHPPEFVNGNEFHPATPQLPGAVMNGLGGTADDQPFVGDGIYNVSEYWTPMVSYTMWLMAPAAELTEDCVLAFRPLRSLKDLSRRVGLCPTRNRSHGKRWGKPHPTRC